jgi:hypothetical protein
MAGAVLGLLLIGMITGALLLGFHRYSSRTQRLPDGSLLKLVSIDYGHSHFYSVPAPNRWQSFLLKHLPPKWAARLGLWDANGSVGSSARPGESNLGIITICQQAISTSPVRWAEMEVFDEQGRDYGAAHTGASSGSIDARHNIYWQLACWTLNSDIPTDAKRLVLKISAMSADGTRCPVAEFVVPNPVQKGTNQAATGKK